MNWTIKQNDHNKKWYFSVSGVESADCVFPQYEEMKARAVQAGVPAENLINARQFERYLDKIVYGKTLPIPLEIELDPSFDARLIIESDKTKAVLYIRKAKDAPHSVDKKLITNMLNNSGIENIDFKSLDEKITAFSAAAEREIELVVAEGILPQRGKNRTLIPHITKLQNEQAAALRKKLIHAVETAREQAQVIYDKDFPLSEAQYLAVVERNDLLFEFSQSEIGEDGMDIYGNPIPGLPGNDPFVLDLRNVEQTNDHLKAACSGILLLAQNNEGLKLRIIPYKDAEAKAVISEDNMEAILVMESGKGAGSRLSLSQLKKALEAVNLPENRYSDDILKDAMYEAHLSSRAIEFTVSRGIEPVAPHSYKFDWKVQFGHSNTVSVKRGEVLLETTLLEAGEKGVDVFGNIIEIDKAEVLKLPQTDTTVRSTQDGKKVVFTAAAAGEFVKSTEMLKILNSKTIATDVNNETGDILFAGDIIVNGNIDANRSIKAGGSLTVNGDAGISLLYTKESLLMNGGIRGGSRGTVWTKNTMALHFAETARLFAGGNIYIDDYCFRCVVKTNGELAISGEPGSFIGGNAHAARGMKVRNLGDYKTVRTIISFGQDYLIKDRIEVYEKQTQENLAALARIESELENPATPADRIQELREQKVILLKSNTALGIKIFKLKEHFESHIPSAVTITGTVYPGVILESHGRYYEVREPTSHVVFTFDPELGRIICKPIDEKPAKEQSSVLTELE
ncbi:MAG: FapA family protein [Treponema sp.]|uniref:FapA family protein n=1 Tax=Treponema sp. TaxID=166 RepID=UPI003FA26C41